MKIGIIGAGSIGSRHIKDIAAIGGHPMRVYDIDPARAQAACLDEWTFAVSTPEELWSWQPAAVIICTPPDSHIEWAAAAAEHGAYVFIEKPLALSWEGVDGLRLLLAVRGLVSHVACPLRYVPEFIDARKHIGYNPARHSILLAQIVGQYDLRVGRPDFATSYHGSTGALLDIGSHAVDLAQWLFGPATLRRAEVDRNPWLGQYLPAECDTSAQLILEHASKTLSAIYVNWVCEHRLWRVSTGPPEGAGDMGWTLPDYEIDGMYRSEMIAFLAACHAGKGADNPVSEAAQTLALLLEAKSWQGQ